MLAQSTLISGSTVQSTSQPGPLVQRLVGERKAGNLHFKEKVKTSNKRAPVWA